MNTSRGDIMNIKSANGTAACCMEVMGDGRI